MNMAIIDRSIDRERGREREREHNTLRIPLRVPIEIEIFMATGVGWALCVQQQSALIKKVKNRTKTSCLQSCWTIQHEASRTQKYSTCTTTWTAHSTWLLERLIIYGSKRSKIKTIGATKLYNWAVHLYVKHSLNLLPVSESPLTIYVIQIHITVTDSL